MANYNCTFRTNYFKVKDNKKFEEFMTHVYAEDLEVFHKTDKNGNELYGFGGYGGISGYFNDKNEYENDDEAWDNAYDNFIDGLTKQVAGDDAKWEQDDESLCTLRNYSEAVNEDEAECEDDLDYELVDELTYEQLP